MGVFRGSVAAFREEDGIGPDETVV